MDVKITGIMLGVVLMTGETVQEMQQAGRISTTKIGLNIPDWMGLWFSVIPTVETLASQVFAVIFVLGSYFAYQYLRAEYSRIFSYTKKGLSQKSND
jgi:high-affinity iron transporter